MQRGPAPSEELPVGQILRRLVRPVYLPWGTASLGFGMLLPVLPLHLEENGLSFTAVSVVIAAAAVGSSIGGIPASAVLGRVGERGLLVGALVLMAFAVSGLGLTTAVVVLVAFQLAYGAGQSGLVLSRQTLLTRSVRPAARGRAMSMMGGTARLASFVGPLAGGIIFDQFGARATFLVVGGVTLAGLVPILGSGAHLGAEEPPADPDQPSLASTLRRHRRHILRTGAGPALIMAARRGRLVVVPLIGDALGLGPTAVGALVAVGTGADLLLFPVSGLLMDRYGRLFAIVPAFTLMAAGLFLLGTAESAGLAVVAGVVMGVGNGMSSGTMLTLASDLAPPGAVGPYMASMSAVQGVGGILGALIVGAFADLVGLSTSAMVLGGVLVVGVLLVVVLIGETASHGRFLVRPAISSPSS